MSKTKKGYWCSASHRRLSLLNKRKKIRCADCGRRLTATGRRLECCPEITFYSIPSHKTKSRRYKREKGDRAGRRV